MGTLRFILGRAGSGKTSFIVDEIRELLRAEPLGEPILLLVPDQATLLYERMLAQASETGGYLRLSVLTFSHLIERLLGEGGGSAIPEITPLGRRILIGRLLRRMQPTLQFYKSTARQPGLAAKLDEAFAEIERSGRSLDDLLFIAGDLEAQNPQSSLPAKLRDLHALMREYETVLGSERIDQHRRFAHALKAAERSRSVAGTRLYVDDFHDFISTERALILQMARVGLQATVTLPVDPAKVPMLTGTSPIDESMLLRTSSLAFRRLSQGAAKEGVATEIVRMTSAPRFRSGELLHVDRQFEAVRPGRIATRGEVNFVEATTRRDEVDAAARQIQRWAGEGIRLREILVLARDIGEYERDLESSFREHGIASFIDRQRPASHHPLIRTVRALLQLPLTDFRHDVILDLIKAGLTGVSVEAADAMENYLLAHRVRGISAWAQEWRYTLHHREEEESNTYRREQLDAINATRGRIHEGLASLLTDDAPRPAGDWCRRLCQAMEALRVPQALSEQIAARESAGQLELAASDHAVWSEFTELLDQLCSVLGDEPLTLREYTEVLDVALERFTLAITPPTIDQVLAGSVNRTRSANVKACIVLGLSEGVFPKRSDDVAALNDEDRHHLDVRQFELKSDSRRQLMDEQTLAYFAFTRASDRLLLLRNVVDGDGRHLGPSVFWTQMLRLFKDPIITPPAVGSAVDSIATPAQLADAIVDWALRTDSERAADELSLTHWFLQSSDARLVRARHSLNQAMKYRNEAALSAGIAKRLFPDPVSMSATRLETFAACPFKHYAQYTLGLRTRDAADLTRLDLGTVYHQVLENLIREAIHDRTDLAKPIPDLEERIRTHSEHAAAQLRSEFMLTPGRNQYLLEGVRDTVEHIVETQRHAIGAGAFRPRQTEFAFGFDPKKPPLTITTPNGRAVHLRGKIDRIDAWSMGQEMAASVVDYKLSDNKADFARIRHGLSLQLVTYLLVLEAMGESLIGAKVKPAAAFYVRLLRQIESIDHPSSTPDPNDPDTYLSRYKPRGIVDERFIQALDTNDALSLKPIKNAEDLRRGDVLQADAFDALLRWTRLKLAQLADQILDGVAKVTPYKIKTTTPCSTCHFRSVCRLDLAFNRYFPIIVSPKDALATIVAEAK